MLKNLNDKKKNVRKIGEKGKRKVWGNFIGFTISSSLSLVVALIIVDLFNGYQHHFDHLPMPSTTYSLQAHKFLWMKCAIQIEFPLMKYILQIQ